MDMICSTRETISRSNTDGTYVGSKTYSSRLGNYATIRSRAISKVKKLRTVLVEPKRFVWVSTDRDTFEELIRKLAELNSFLIALLDSSRVGDLEKDMDASYLEILQVRDDIESLRNLVLALTQNELDAEGGSVKSCPSGAIQGECLCGQQSTPNMSDEARRKRFRRLVGIKIQRISVDQPGNLGLSPLDTELGCGTFDLSPMPLAIPWISDPERERARISQRPCRQLRKWNEQTIWIERLSFPSSMQGDKTARERAKARSLLLAELLKMDLPTEFRSPQCLGYVTESKTDEPRFGIVFKVPIVTEMAAPLLSTLLELLTVRPKPSLSNRISLCCVLAESIHNFHAVDWLHKGLRSENILFFGPPPTSNHKELLKPYITGFELSRPSDEPHMTEKAVFDPLADLYRHPFAQAGYNAASYRKSYDIYSFGIILLEIGLWRPIHAILKFDDFPRVRLHDLRMVRQRLLGGSLDCPQDSAVGDIPFPSTASLYLQRVADKCGDSYRDVVELCVVADEIEKPAYRGESYASRSRRLLMMFDEQVLGRLRVMKEALQGVS